MKNPQLISSLVAIKGRSHPDVNASSVKRGMSTVGEMPVKTINNRTILIERDAMIDQYSPEEAFEAIVDKIADITTHNREEIENILIATGSARKVRKMKRRSLNAEIQNRLVEDTVDGKRFRGFLTAMIAHLYGRNLVEDGFFRVRGENKAGSHGGFHYGTDTDLPTGTISTGSSYTGSATDKITPYEKTDDGGVKQTKSEKDWGSIFSGSAQLINSVGGLLGLFTGGKTGTGDNNIFNDKSDEDLAIEQARYEAERKARNTKIVLGVLGAIALIVVVVLVVRAQKDKKGTTKKK